MSSRQWAVFDKDGKRVTPAVSDSIRAWEPLLRTDGYEDEELLGLIVRLQAEGYVCRAVGIAPLMTPGSARKYARRHDNRNALQLMLAWEEHEDATVTTVAAAWT